MFSSGDFHIDALFCLDATAAVHQHGFTGAFQVLHGSSLHVEYAFDEVGPVDEALLVGELRTKRSDWLRAGAYHTILPNRGLIHSLYHLDYPCVSMVVRLAQYRGAELQWAYLPPNLANAREMRMPCV